MSINLIAPGILGVIFDSSMTLEKQLNNISKRVFFELKRKREIGHHFSQEAAERQVHSFLLSITVKPRI